MKPSIRSIALVSSLCLLATLVAAPAGAKTMLRVASDPPGARFQCDALGRSGSTSTEIEIPKAAFAGARSIVETIRFDREGYAPVQQTVTVYRGKKNAVHVKLEKIDSFLEVRSTPPGAEVTLTAPLLGVEKFTTPYGFAPTATLAAAVAGSVSIDRVFLEGYLADPSWVNRPLSLPASQRTAVNIELQRSPPATVPGRRATGSGP